MSDTEMDADEPGSFGGGSSLLAWQQIEENQLRQIHDYIRHSFQTFVAWFTVFATINYFAFGWMVSVARDGTSTGASSFSVVPLALPVAIVFAIQNVLAFLGADAARAALKQLGFEAESRSLNHKIIPLRDYDALIKLMRSGIVATGALWVLVAVLSGVYTWRHWPPPWW